MSRDDGTNERAQKWGDAQSGGMKQRALPRRKKKLAADSIGHSRAEERKK